MVTPPVLFIDFDGVLHPFDEPALDEQFQLLPNPRLFCWLPLLEELLAPYPDLRLVVSSDWRRLFDDASLVRLLGSQGGRFAGVVETCQASRADELWYEARRRGLTRWLALDDHPTVVSASQREPRFIACAPETGLSLEPVQAELRCKLAELHQGR